MRAEQLLPGTVFVISEAGASVYAAPDRESDSKDKIDYLSIVKLKPGDTEAYQENEFISILGLGNDKYVERSKLVKIESQHVSPDGQRMLLELINLDGIAIEYKRISNLAIFSVGKLRLLPISRSQLELIEWLDNKHIVLTSSSGDGGFGSESTYRVNIEDYKEYRIHGSSYSTDESGKCQDTSHCVCSFETYYSGTGQYYVETYPAITFYKIPTGNTKKNRCKMGMDKRTLFKLKTVKLDAASLPESPSYDRNARDGLRIKVGNTVYFIDGETDKITTIISK